MIPMHDLEVLVLDADEAAAQIAEFYVDGRRFAMSILRDGDLVLELDPSPDRTAPTIVAAHSLALTLERLESY
jgi:hypothetical protein